MITDMVFFSDERELESAKKRFGISSFIVAKEFKSIAELEHLKKSLPKSYKTCFVLKRKDEKALRTFFHRTDFVAVIGGNISMNRFAVENKMVDFLVAPCTIERANIDAPLLNTAEQNGVSVVVPFNAIFSLSPFRQAQLLKHYFVLAKLCKRYRVKCFVFSLAEKISELKSPAELFNLGKEFGFSEEQLVEWCESVVE